MNGKKFYYSTLKFEFLQQTVLYFYKLKFYNSKTSSDVKKEHVLIKTVFFTLDRHI